MVSLLFLLISGGFFIVGYLAISISRSIENIIRELAEDGKIVPGVNTTVDVQPGETERQAKKLFPMNKDGKPKPLGVKGATPHQAFNLGLD